MPVGLNTRLAPRAATKAGGSKEVDLLHLDRSPKGINLLGACFCYLFMAIGPLPVALRVNHREAVKTWKRTGCGGRRPHLHQHMAETGWL